MDTAIVMEEKTLKEVRVGVIGVGNIGYMHATNLFENKILGMKLTAVCDIKGSRLAHCSRCFPGIRYYQNYIELIKSKTVDAVIISVPHKLHAKIAMEALKEGLHVLVEKPIDITVTAAKELLAVAEKSNKIFAIMFNQRTNSLFQKAHDIVQGGLLGEIKRSVWIVTNWYRSQAYYNSGDWRATWSGEGGGVLLNQAPHNLDLWQWVCGMPVSVTAFCNVAKYHDIDVEDEAIIYTKYKNDATGVFITSTGEYPGTNRFEISGDRGKMVLENSTLKWWRLVESEREICYTSEVSFPEIKCEYQEFTADRKESGHIGIIQNFANAIMYGERLIAPGAEGINELMISNAAYLSQWNGNTEIEIPFDSKQFDCLLEKQNDKFRKISYISAENIGENLKRWQVRW